MKNSLTFLVQQLLIQNQFRINKDELSFQIESHPSYPSLHAVTGVLDHFNISNIALDVPVTENVVRQLPETFLAQLSTIGGSEFAVVKNKGLSYEVRTNVGKKTILSLAEFLDKFTGILVAIEQDDELHKNRNISSNVSKAMATLIGFIGVAYFVFMASNSYIILFFCFALLGVFVSYSIYKQEQGETSFLGNAFCSNESEKKGCNAVLSSKGARLFKAYKLSDLSLSYFIGLSIATYLFTIFSMEAFELFAISFIAIPMTLFSIYYQQVVVKKWCLLCLTIVAIVWIQGALAVIHFSIPDSFYLKGLAIIGSSFLIAFTLWEYIKTVLKTANELTKNKVEYTKFKRNYDVFKALLEKSKPIDTSLNTKEIILGNADAPLQLTIITNPMCGFCRKVHALIEDIHRKYPVQVSIGIRFNVNTTNLESDSVNISSRLLDLYDQNSKTCLSAMHDIYNGERPIDWFAKWGTSIYSSNYIEVLKQQKSWCNTNAINFTPEILVNGKSFPKAYDRGDLIYFIEELIEDRLHIKNKIQVIN